MKKIINNPYIQIFFSFFKFGLYTIGGGLAMIPFIQRTVVDEKKWLTQEEFLDGVTIAQGLPGIVAINLATYIGYKKKGVPGAICSTAGVIMPSLIIMILVALFMREFSENRFVAGALMGVKACAVGLIICAVVTFGKLLLKSVYAWIMAILSFVAVVFTSIPVVYIVLAGVLVGIIYSLIQSKKMKEVD